MSTHQTDDMALMAYADGELDDVEADRVEATLARDPAALRKVASFMRSRRLARSAGRQAPSPAPTGPLRQRSWALIAACLAGALVSAVGYTLVQRRSGSSDEIMALDQTIARALDRTVSGEKVALSQGVLEMVATSRLSEGGLCREFRLQYARQIVEGLACHEAGGWRPRLLVSRDFTPGQFAPAGGIDPIDAALREQNAGPALTGSDEVRALADLQ